MNWKLWQRNDRTARPVPDEIINIIKFRMELSEPEMKRLMFVQQNGTFVNRPVTHFRVFDPAKLGDFNGNVTYSTLDVKRDAVLFEGHTESSRGIVLYDRRTGKQPAHNNAAP